MGIIFALLASLSFAFGYTALKKSYTDFPPSVAFFLDVVFGLLIWVPFGLFFGVEWSKLSSVIIYAVISAVLAEAFFFYVLSKGEISLTGTILASYPIYTVLLSFFINNERLSPLTWVFVVITILGTIIISYPTKIKKGELRKKEFVIWAVAGAVAVGLSDTLTKHIINQTNSSTFIFTLALVQVPIALIYMRLEKQSLGQFSKILKGFKKYQFSLLGGFLNIVGTLFLLLSFQFALVSIAAPIGASYPAIMVVLALIFLKDKITKKDFVGIILVLASIIGISLLNP